jgi:hypothetical protein
MTALAHRFDLPPLVNVPTSMPAPDDLYAMLVAWNSGSATQRAVALECADRNRCAAVSIPIDLTTPAPANAKDASPCP